MKRIPGIAVFFFSALFACEQERDCVAPEQCSWVPDSGPCKAYMPRYYFDKVEGKCKEFIWGGCGGVVPFDTLEACQQCKCNE